MIASEADILAVFMVNDGRCSLTFQMCVLNDSGMCERIDNLFCDGKGCSVQLQGWICDQRKGRRKKEKACF
jgi:hypothetical protein